MKKYIEVILFYKSKLLPLERFNIVSKEFLSTFRVRGSNMNQIKLYVISFLAVLGGYTFQAQAENLNSIDENWVTAESVVEFQPFSEVQTGELAVGSDQKISLTLTNLNKHIDGWYLLLADISATGTKKLFNIENNFPNAQEISLLSTGELEVKNKQTGESIAICNVLGETGTDGEIWAAVGADPYMSLCGGYLSLRNNKDGNKDLISWGTTWLRALGGDTGDQIVNMVKENLYDGEFYESGQELQGESTSVDSGGPANARIKPDSGAISDHKINIQTKEDLSQGMAVGQWYAARNYEGVFVSVMKPKFVEDAILDTFKDRVNAIDTQGGGNQSRAVGEGNAIAVSMAIDLSKHSIAWHNGTEHPGVGWSSRAQVRHQNAAGPDGFGTLKPLEFPGVVNPTIIPQLIGTFAGGFQRRHSAFKWAPYTSYNRGHHYGFMENGVVMSKLVPNLASLITYANGDVTMKTWQPSDADSLHLMKDVRQNGVPLIEAGEPSVFVNQWGPGNWSGSAEAVLKTPRTSACLYEEGRKKYLIVSYFSTHTPSAMARVLQSYGCTYAIHLDMNHPKFAYAALFNQKADGAFDIEHLHQSMAGEDVRANNVEAPRSILTPTYKDFFTIFKR